MKCLLIFPDIITPRASDVLAEEYNTDVQEQIWQDIEGDTLGLLIDIRIQGHAYVSFMSVINQPLAALGRPYRLYQGAIGLYLLIESCRAEVWPLWFNSVEFHQDAWG